jgi:hypothetical protein
MARTGSRKWASVVMALATGLLLGCGTLGGNDFLNEQEEQRELGAGEAELDRLLLPPNWRKTRSVNGAAEGGVHGLYWIRDYETSLTKEEALQVFTEAAHKTGFRECTPDDTCSARGLFDGEFLKERYRLHVDVYGSQQCAAPAPGRCAVLSAMMGIPRK